MPVVVCQDFAGLELELFRRIDAAREENPFAPLAVVAPTGRILARLRRVILESGRTYLNLHLLHHRALAERILDGAADPLLRVAGWEILLPVLESILAGPGGVEGSINRYALRYAGARISLLGTLRDLRDAHADPDRTERILGEAHAYRDLGRIYSSFCGAIDRLEAMGWTDTAGLAEHAIGFASRSPFLDELQGLFHFGAYDLIQVHQDLLDAVSRHVPVTFLVPGGRDGAAFRFAAGFLDRPPVHSAGPPEPISTPAERRSLLSGRLHHLHDDSLDPPPALPDDRVEVVTAAGVRLELEAVARRVLRAHGQGVELHDMGVVARTLEPYAPHLESVFEGFGIPFVTSAEQPLLRYPGPLTFLHLIRVLDDDFPRSAVIDLFRSPLFRLDDLVGRDGVARPDRWDRWSREARIVGGRTDWTRRLPAWARRQAGLLDRHSHPFAEMDDDEFERLRESCRERVGQCDRLAKLIEGLARKADDWNGMRSWPQHAAYLQDLAGQVLDGWGDPDRGPESRLAVLLDQLAVQESAHRAGGGPRGAVTRELARRRIEALLSEATFQPTGQSESGIAILDAMQARGESFRILFLIGLSSDQWPRRIHPDPFLPDAERRRIRERLGVQVPVNETAREEDRLLLAFLLASAREKLVLSYQRADDDGRARAHASAWREIARLAAGEAESAALLERQDRVVTIPTDPALRARFELSAAGGNTGILSPEEGVVLAASLAADPAGGMIDAMHRAGDLTDRIRRGGDYIRAVGRWDPADLSRDGAVDEPVSARRFQSASRLERLGLCPLQYFFRFELGVEELDDPEEDEIIDRLLAGVATHQVLETIYRELREKPAFPIADLDRAVGFALSRLDEVAPGIFQPLREIVEPRHRLIWSIYWRHCIGSLRAFLRWDLERLRDEQARPEEPELDVEDEVEVPCRDGSRPLGLRGRIDRIDRLPGGDGTHRLRIADYKTSARLEEMVAANSLLQGIRPQLAVYYFLTGKKFPADEVVEARIYGVGPEHPDPARDEDRHAPRLGVFATKNPRETWRAVGDTLHTLAGYAAAGRFPFRRGQHCSWCPYRPACRRNHPPTVERVKAAPAYRSYFDLSDRSVTKLWGKKK